MAPGCGPQLALAPKATLGVTQIAFLPRAHAVSEREGHRGKEADHAARPSAIRGETGLCPVLVNLWGTCQQKWPWPTQETHTIPYTQ